jgi:hypothetical protein
MLWWIKISSMIVFFAIVYLTPVPVTTNTVVLMVLSFVPWVLCVIEEYRIGKRLDKELGR